MQTEGELRPDAALPAMAAAPAHIASPDFCLGLVYPRDVERCFRLGAEPKTIGSGRNADIVLNDDAVSPVHCCISLDHGNVVVEDLGSPGGTLIDGKTVATAPLKSGQLLQVGHFRFTLREQSGAPEGGAAHAAAPAVRARSVGGMPNRAWIRQRLERAMNARAGSERPVTVALLAMDALEALRDRLGTTTGEALLRRAARLIAGHLRDKECYGLYSSDRILVVLPDVEKDEAGIRLTELCTAFAQRPFTVDEQSAKVDLSVGFATRQGLGADAAENFLTHVERALYRARRWGGNRAVTLD